MRNHAIAVSPIEGNSHLLRLARVMVPASYLRTPSRQGWRLCGAVRLASVPPRSYAPPEALTHRSRISTADSIVVIDSSEIRDGKIEELKTALTKLVEFVEANEAEPIAYSIYIDEDGSRMTVMQIHPSSASMELHMGLAGPIFRKFTELVVLSRVDFYGVPSDALLEQMRQKVELLGNAPVVVNELHAGFARFETAQSDDATRLDDGLHIDAKREEPVTGDRPPMSAT
jgi:hypothetical protein